MLTRLARCLNARSLCLSETSQLSKDNVERQQCCKQHDAKWHRNAGRSCSNIIGGCVKHQDLIAEFIAVPVMVAALKDTVATLGELDG